MGWHKVVIGLIGFIFSQLSYYHMCLTGNKLIGYMGVIITLSLFVYIILWGLLE